MFVFVFANQISILSSFLIVIVVVIVLSSRSWSPLTSPHRSFRKISTIWLNRDTIVSSSLRTIYGS